MPFIPTPNGIRVAMHFTSAGQQCRNIFHVKGPAEPTVGDLIDVAAVFIAWWTAEMRPLTATTTTLDAVEVTDITSASDDGVVVTTTLPLAGTSGGNALPNNATVVTKLTSGLTGRSRRGRSYMVGLTDSNLSTDKQHVSTAMQGVLQDAFRELISALVTAGLELAVASFFADGAPRTEGLLTPITDAQVNPSLDSQRRRLPERGA